MVLRLHAAEVLLDYAVHAGRLDLVVAAEGAWQHLVTARHLREVLEAGV
jgi:hypothetical protein